jgi:hypothetical protein
MATSKKGPGYISAIESVIESHKLYVLLCGAPLVALVAQLQWVRSLDSFAIKTLITVSVFCFIAAGAFSVLFLDLARHYLAKTNLESDPNGASDSPYMRYVLEIYSHGIGDMTEENIVRIARMFMHPLVYAMGFGWLSVVLALVIAIWT